MSTTSIQKLTSLTFNKLVKLAIKNGSSQMTAGNAVVKTLFEINTDENDQLVYSLNGMEMFQQSFMTELRLCIEIERARINPIKSELARAPHNGYIGAESNVDSNMSMVNKDGSSKEFKTSAKVMPNVCRGNAKKDKSISFHTYQDLGVTVTKAQKLAKSQEVMNGVYEKIRNIGSNLHRTKFETPKDSSKAARNKRRREEKASRIANM